MSRLEPAQDRRAVAEIRAALPGVVAIYRLGSSADVTAGRESDVDLAVLATVPLGAAARFDLQERTRTGPAEAGRSRRPSAGVSKVSELDNGFTAQTFRDNNVRLD